MRKDLSFQYIELKPWANIRINFNTMSQIQSQVRNVNY